MPASGPALPAAILRSIAFARAIDVSEKTCRKALRRVRSAMRRRYSAVTCSHVVSPDRSCCWRVKKSATGGKRSIDALRTLFYFGLFLFGRLFDLILDIARRFAEFAQSLA